MQDKSFLRDNIFQGKVIAISGGTSKMLYQIAEDFMRLGGNVALFARREAELQKVVSDLNALFPNCLVKGYKLDVRKQEDIEKVIDSLLHDLKRIDVLVNGAAGNFLAEAEKLSPNGFKTVIEIDTLGTFFLSKVVYIKYMKKNGGSIINITALLHYLGTLMQSHASAAKAAVDALTRTLALEWGPKGVRVNGVAPGFVEGSEGFDRLIDGERANSKENLLAKKTNEEELNIKKSIIASKIPLQRFGNRKDISNTVLFLASEASSYITGQNILVDGGTLAIFPNWLILDEKFVKKWRSKF